MENFVVIRAIGTGGRVFLVRQLTTAKCFSMVMHGYTGGNDKNSKESVVREVKLLAQQLQHPHILGIRDWFFHANNRLCLIVDFASGGTLELKIKNQSDKLGRFQEAEVMHMAVQLLMALDFIHDRKILHRNIKPSSVSFSSLNIVKLGDFGVTGDLDEGNAHYACPERTLNDFCTYMDKTDMWAFGCLLLETCTLKHPFIHTAPSAKGYFEAMPQGYSCQLSKTISSLLALRPENRPNAKDLLNSTFIQHHLDHFIEEKENIRVFYQERKTMLNLSPCIFRTKKHFVPYHLTLSPTRYDHGGSCDILEMTPTVVSRRASLLSNEELLKAPNNQCDTRRPKSSLGLVRTPADPSDYLLSPQTRTRLLSPEPLFNRFGSESAFSDTEFNSNDKLSEGDILDRNGHTDFTPDSEIREIPYIYTDDTDDLADESDQEWDEVIRSARHTRSTAASLGPNPLKKQLSDTTAQLAKKHSVILKTKTWSI